MSDFDEVIRAAREGFEPRAADGDRIWASLVTRMGGASAAVAVALAAKTSVGASATSSALAGQSVAALTKLFFASVAVTLAGSGAVVGVTRFVARSGDPPSVLSSPNPRATAPAVESRPAGSDGRAVSVPPPPDLMAGDPAARRQGPVASLAAEAPDRQELARELALLREVRSASERGDHARAAHVLEILEEQHPRGALLEERAALRAVTACEAGTTSRVERARDFLRRYPASVYTAKVKRVCETDDTRSRATESATRSFTDPIDGGH